MQRRNLPIWSALLAMLVAGSACVLEADAPRKTHAEIRNGIPDTDDPHVVAMQPRQTMCGLPVTPFCTGTLIAPRVVLTAAHCFNSFEAGSIEVFVGNDVAEGGDVIYAEEVLVHPAYDRTTLANDIALIRLPVELAVEPAPLLLPGDTLSVGAQVRLVGFGITGPEMPMSAGIKREGTAEVAELFAQTFSITPAPAMSCDGDSGGPVFATVDTDEVVAGVTSTGDEQCQADGVNTRVDAFADDFILPYVDETADAPVAPDAGPPRPGVVEDVCTDTCTGDRDCPEGTACQFIAGRAQCAYPGLPVGYFDGACELTGDCPGGTCIARERAGRPECACYYACATPTPDAGAPDGQPDAGPCEGDCGGGDGCGCSVGHRGPGAWPLLYLLCLLAWRRPRRTRPTNS